MNVLRLACFVSALCFTPQCASAQGTPNFFSQQQIVNDLSKQVDAQQKVLADLNTKISQQNEVQQSTHANEIQQNMQAQTAVIASIQRQIAEAKNQSNNLYLSQADEIQKNRVDREQTIKSVQDQLLQQRQIVAGLQNQLQAQLATNVDSDLLDYFEQATAEQQAKLNELEDLNRSLQVEAGQVAAGEDFSQHQDQSSSQENIQALQSQYEQEIQKYSQMQSQYQQALNANAKAQDQLSHLADEYEVQREKYLDLQQKFSDASSLLGQLRAQSKKLKPQPSPSGKA